MSDYLVTNPATGLTGPSFLPATDEQLRADLAGAAATHAGWSRTTTVAERARLIQRVAELHTQRRQELAGLIVEEMGKPLQQALEEVDFSADIYAYYATHGAAFLADEPIELLGGEGTAFIRRTSLGPVLGIMPWNFPYYQVARFAGPNLVLGNPVLLKHAPQCPQSAAAIQQIFHDAGFPPGAYTNLYASTDQIAWMIADPRVQGVSLTGSERAGAAVAEIAGRHLKKVVLELGGSDPFILLSTEDMDEAVAAAVTARLNNTGQTCNAAKRFIVMEELFEEFFDRFTTRLSGIPLSDPTGAECLLGPLSSRAAAEHLESQLERAVAQGATLVAGGGRDGAWFRSAVITDVDPDNDAYHEEFFGPVAALYRAADEDEAIRLANDTPFGLGSYVFTTDPEQALRVADRIEAGMVFINGVDLDSPELPFGGIKRSGFGRELGRLGIEEFANRKLVRIRR